MTNEYRGGFVLDRPDQIQAYVLLQVYFKLKMEAEHPGGPTWRGSAMNEAKSILNTNGVECKKRTKKGVLVIYKKFLVDNSILSES